LGTFTICARHFIRIIGDDRSELKRAAQAASGRVNVPREVNNLAVAIAIRLGGLDVYTSAA
jgi:hypothetical protein